MSRTRAALTAALLLVSALAISGCSDDDPVPKRDPSPTSIPTTASTSPTPEALGPEETVRAWVAAHNEALASGDTSAVEAWSADNCRTCENAVDPIRQVYADGGHFDTAGWKVSASRVKSESDSTAKVVAGIRYAAGTTVPKRGAEPMSYGVERHIIRVGLVKVGGRWLVKFIGYLS